MSNADSAPRPEGAQDEHPDQPTANPDTGPDTTGNRPAEPPPQAAEQPQSAPTAAAPASQAAGQQPQSAPTTAMPPAAAGPPHMTAPGQAPPGWDGGAAAPPGPPMPPPGYGPPPAAPPRRGRGRLVAGAVALALIAGGAGGAAGWALSDRDNSTTVVESVSMDAGGGKTYTEIVDQVTQSVVTIVTDSAEGSGVVYSEDGHIVTNNHVVDGARSLEVRFADGSVGEAEVLATDPTQDLAVLEVDGVDDLTPVEFGDSDALQVGDATVAIGSPLGLEGTVTTGIVSALNRSMAVGGEAPEGMGEQSGQNLSGLIQTDAAINMGNSGGALVNGSGELIGINTAILSTESGSVGLGFAIPSNSVAEVVDQLIANGSVEQGFLGVQVSDTQGNGAMVLEVEPDSPAEEAGLVAGDIITEVDGAPISNASEVVSSVQSKASGDQLAITYERDGAEETTEATLDAA